MICNTHTWFYDQSILPLLHRMINLKELALHIVVDSHKEFIDGNNLKRDLINHLHQLNQFVFNIRSIIHR